MCTPLSSSRPSLPISSHILLSTSSTSPTTGRAECSLLAAVDDAAAVLPGGALAGVRVLHARCRVPQPRRHGLRLLPDACLARRPVGNSESRHRHGVPARIHLEVHRSPCQLLHFAVEPLRLHHSHLLSHWFHIYFSQLPLC